MDPPASNTRARSKLSPASQPNGTFADEPSTATIPPSSSPRVSPFLPTPIEAALLLAYPVLLTFGTFFSLVSPTVRNAPYDPFIQAHSQDPAFSPSYFARKSNIFNVFFVKRGWAWISLAFFVFLFSHPATATTQRRARALLRWGLVTTWWVLVTQWCFGPALIDRGFRFTGGKCEIARANIDADEASKTDVLTGVACRAAGGRWYGGHDISGHVFLLVLGSYFLVQEVGWAYLQHWRRGAAGPVAIRDDRSVVMHDGAIKSAGIEAERLADVVEIRVLSAWDALGLGGKVAGTVVALSWWMILMTAIFFHTWFEKHGSKLDSSFSLINVARRNGRASIKTTTPYATDTMSPVKVPANLPELVRATFNKAKANGDVNFYPTQVAILTPTASTPFQLRFSPSLANKPKSGPSNSSSSGPKPKPFNPFESPPEALTIAPLEPSHVLVLNKFAIVPEHFLLITRVFEPQTHLLRAEDLAATYACLRAYHDHTVEGEREELFAFFNSGEHSGASQPHRHLQLLPIARMRDGLEDAAQNGKGSWGVLADQLAGAGEKEGGASAAESAQLPFSVFAERLRPDVSGSDLRAAYMRLYERACAAAGVVAEAEDGAGTAGEARISYNMAMTRDTMVLCPRTAEGDVVRDKAGKEVGRLALNGTVLAGTALVKSQAEWDALRGDGDQLWRILGGIGVPSAVRSAAV